ncbi:MAG: molybdenum cofactor biosynthesis protein MoaE [Paracoccaceae bacterium]
MTEKAIMLICEDAQKRWNLYSIRVIHRVGRLFAGDNIVLVVTASEHRKEAFKSAEFIMDFLKSRAPIWKKEHYKTHSSWVHSKEVDELTLNDW